MSVSIQQEDFDIASELDALRKASAQAGALVSFTGLVRDFSEAGKVDSIFLEHYPGMSEKALHNIISEAESRWRLLGVRIIHRVGELRPNEQIVLVATASAHRADAFAACEFIMDYLKTSAPFWKREQTDNGANWLDTKASDVQRAERWVQQGDME
jgi:molybdopterin synthase catalytic subunit